MAEDIKAIVSEVLGVVQVEDHEGTWRKASSPAYTVDDLLDWLARNEVDVTLGYRHGLSDAARASVIVEGGVERRPFRSPTLLDALEAAVRYVNDTQVTT